MYGFLRFFLGHPYGFTVCPAALLRTSRVEFSCHGTGSVSTTCSTASAVYLSQRCDLNRNSGAVVKIPGARATRCGENRENAMVEILGGFFSELKVDVSFSRTFRGKQSFG